MTKHIDPLLVNCQSGRAGLPGRHTGLGKPFYFGLIRRGGSLDYCDIERTNTGIRGSDTGESPDQFIEAGRMVAACVGGGQPACQLGSWL